MQTSAKGIAALEHEEGVVLRAYLCPAHRWTIGAGLTAASGVIVPKAGMVITREGATAALAQALERNYEPRVRKAMPGAKQHEFDAGVSFDFNTGAIHKATWVKRWLSKAAPAVIRDSLAQWNKGGGKVLPGLVSRRKREADMLLLGVYPSSASPPAVPPDLGAQWARWGLALSVGERMDAVDALRRLGYSVGDRIDAVALEAARAFQADHGLTVDGILGRASLSTLQRRIDAAAKGKAPLAAAAVSAPVAASDPSSVFAVPDGLEFLPLAGSGLWIARFIWVYRDHVAAVIAPKLPRLAAFLRSF
ncbi:MAG: peptidoglycan-binding protein [Fuscovulum sp.]|nr:peptidoglycan-binding protein [Fuscovulum sp.]